jgi:uncharacterized protein YyaL (SSP411 family)
MDFHLDPGTEIVCMENQNDQHYADTTREHVLKINDRYIPNKVVLIDSTTGNGDTSRLTKALKTDLDLESPLLENRGLQDGRATVYICRNFSCDKPITDLADLESKIAQHSGSGGSRV